MLVGHFHHQIVRDDTTDPRLQRFVLVTSGDVPTADIPPIIGSHKFGSFTLKHLWQRGAKELFSVAQTNIKHITTFSEIIMQNTLIFGVLSSFPLSLTGKIPTLDEGMESL